MNFKSTKLFVLICLISVALSAFVFWFEKYSLLKFINLPNQISENRKDIVIISTQYDGYSASNYTRTMYSDGSSKTEIEDCHELLLSTRESPACSYSTTYQNPNAAYGKLLAKVALLLKKHKDLLRPAYSCVWLGCREGSYKNGECKNNDYIENYFCGKDYENNLNKMSWFSFTFYDDANKPVTIYCGPRPDENQVYGLPTLQDDLDAANISPTLFWGSFHNVNEKYTYCYGGRSGDWQTSKLPLGDVVLP